MGIVLRTEAPVEESRRALLRARMSGAATTVPGKKGHGVSDDEVPPGNSDIPTHRLKAGCSASELRGQMPAEKRCGTCQESKPLTDFNRKTSRPDGHQEVCRECNRASSRQYYRENREHHIRVIRARSDAQRLTSQAFIADYLREHPCIDCGIADLRVLDFDHRPHTDKRDGVMQHVRDGFSIPIIAAEIENCDVRCRNCHAIATYERMPRTWRTDAVKRASGPDGRAPAG